MASALLTAGHHRCPAHADRGPSLHVTQASDGRWLLHCFAGCTLDEILRAAGLQLADLFPAGSAPPGQRRPAPRRLTDAGQARADVLQHAERARAKRADWIFEWAAADQIRRMRQHAERARATGQRLGDTDGAWALFDRAARIERSAHLIESALDGI